jgi:hypothetical protein
VAPDHQSIKAVARVLDRTLADPRVRLFGNVTYGVDLHHKELKRHYDQIVYAVGAQADRRMSVPGEDLPNSHAAIAFVGWYNGHPDYRELPSTSPASGPWWSATATWPWTWPGCWSPPRTPCAGPTWPTTPLRHWHGAASARWWCWGGGARPRRPSPRPSSGSWEAGRGRVKVTGVPEMLEVIRREG